MQSRTAVVIGSTGLIGRHLTDLLLDDNSFDTVRVLVRRPLDFTHPKLEVRVTNFNDPADFKTQLGIGDVMFCCIGTTQQKVKGDKNAYRKIDVDIPVNAARFAFDAGFSKYVIVSSVGANALSNNFYLRLKGEVEEVLTNMGFTSLHIFQPSILLGGRKEARLGEAIGKSVMSALSFMFIAGLQKYKPIQALDVAKAMIAASKQEQQGVKRYQYEEIMKLAK